MTYVQEHPTLGKLELIAGPDDILQANVERFLTEYRAIIDKPFDAFGRQVRAAVAAGWLLEPRLSVDEVGARPAKWVAWAGKLIDQLYSEATTPDPKAFAPPSATPAT